MLCKLFALAMTAMSLSRRLPLDATTQRGQFVLPMGDGTERVGVGNFWQRPSYGSAGGVPI